MRCIRDLEVEEAKISKESELTVLQRCNLRNEILADAKKSVLGQRLINCIPKIKKEDELACVVNLILPKKLRSHLLSNTLNYQFRKIQSLESAKRAGAQRCKRDLRMTLDGSIGSASHLQLATGNLLSVHPGRFPQTNSNLRSRHNKDKLARPHKVEQHQRINSHQQVMQLKKLDGGQLQKSRNEGGPPGVAIEPTSLQNTSPRYGAQARLLHAQLKMQQTRERTSPGLSTAVAINLAGPSGAGTHDCSDSNKNSNSFDNFWSLSNMRIQN